MVSMPCTRSTSSRLRAVASLIRMPVTASSPSKVEYVYGRSPVVEGRFLAALISCMISFWL